MKVAASPSLHVGIPVFSNGFCFAENGDESSESSSIGVESSSEDRGDSGGGEEEVESKQADGPLGSLESLEDSLPIKRGLSNFFTGKSKSFVSLSDVSNAGAGDLAKPENPFNKRRRILNAHSLPSSWAQRRASYISLLPPLEMAEVDDDDDDEETGDDSPLAPLPPNHHHGKAKRAFRSPRSYSLSDLQHV